VIIVRTGAVFLCFEFMSAIETAVPLLVTSEAALASYPDTQGWITVICPTAMYYLGINSWARNRKRAASQRVIPR